MSAPASALQYSPQTIVTRRPLIVWLILAVGALLVLALVALAPVALANNHPSVAWTIYRGFSKVCHQLPERSFFIDGHPLAVCARCTGLYAGFTAALVVYPLAVSLKRTFAPPRKWLFLAALPLAIDFSLTFFGIWENTHSSRFLTGALLGSVAVFYVMPGVVDLALRGWRVASSHSREITSVAPVSVATAPSDYSSPHRRI
ncbi:MAG TPA: DUF2085 domain-containing protein [Pyrinomonadaceae bacterium]|nr:DUF2085 domain-containing protein [Pyrinomonadaceae bacterium]